MANIKGSLVAVLVLVVVLGLGVQSGMATNMANDDFGDATIGAQWNAWTEDGGTVVESGGVLTCTSNGTTGAKDVGGVKNASGYVVPAGDFSVQVDANVTSVSGVGSRFTLSCSEGTAVGESNAYIKMGYKDGAGGGRWWYSAYIYVSGETSHTSSGYIQGGNGWQLKIERVGNVVTEYARLLGSTGAWTQLYSRDDIFTSAMTCSYVDLWVRQANATNGSNITAEFDNFMVPEPATLCLLGLGGIGILVRKKRN